jgi:hypothetical protein
MGHVRFSGFAAQEKLAITAKPRGPVLPTQCLSAMLMARFGVIAIQDRTRPGC